MIKKKLNAKTQRNKDAKARGHLWALRLCLSAPLRYVFAFFLLTGCVPARTPPLLNFTPGPPAVITGETFSNSAFSVRYPTGWRVVTGAADAPPSVVFVAPDEESTITLQVEPPGEPERDPLFRLETRLLSRDGLRLYAIARVPVQEWAAFQPTFERLLASVRPGS
jgi:hypothetical protein